MNDKEKQVFKRMFHPFRISLLLALSILIAAALNWIEADTSSNTMAAGIMATPIVFAILTGIYCVGYLIIKDFK